MSMLLDFLDIRQTAWELFSAFAPLVLFFFYMQKRSLGLPRTYLKSLLLGILFSYIGLVLFLQGVTQGFLPAGTALGSIIASSEWRWALVPLGFLFGLAVTVAEPSVLVLSIEMEKASAGSVKQKTVLITLAMGVGISVALAMFKLLAGIHVLWFLGPGYALALLMTRFSPSVFVASAFDAGGVGTGPMIVTFITAVALGASGAIEGRSPVTDGFGLVALVALAPVLSMLLLGILFFPNKDRST